jgi:hypothetical protein
VKGELVVTQPQPEGIGWYPYAPDTTKRIYWDGTTWSGPVPLDAANAPASSSSDSSDSDSAKKTGIALGVLVFAIVGTVMSQQPVSLFSGSGQIWTGVAIAGVALALSYFLRAAFWVRTIASVCLVFSLFSAIYMETQLNKKRQELTNTFNP